MLELREKYNNVRASSRGCSFVITARVQLCEGFPALVFHTTSAACICAMRLLDAAMVGCAAFCCSVRQMVSLSVRQKADLQDLKSRLRDKEEELEALREEVAAVREQVLMDQQRQEAGVRRRRPSQVSDSDASTTPVVRPYASPLEHHVC